jgi:hypothetical protein
MIACNQKPLRVVCAHCLTDHVLMVNPSDLLKWQAGEYIQDALPYLNKAERELLISQTCDSCWKSMFGEDE